MSNKPHLPCGFHFMQGHFNTYFQKTPGFQSQVGKVYHLAAPELKGRPEAYSSN